MKNKKIVVANYSDDILQAIIAEYNAFIIDYPNDNAAILNTLSAKYGKTVHSLRAKLSSLKVYVTATHITAAASSNKGMTKEALVTAIALLVGRELAGLEVAPKAALQSLYDFIRSQKDKIEQLASDLANGN